MADLIHVQIVTSGGTVFDDRVSELRVPVDGGTIGILADHAPLMGAVTDGVVRCTYADGSEESIAVGIGVLNVLKNEVTILTRAAELAESIDLARAEAAERRARDRLAHKSADVDVTRAEAALHRAIARQDAAKHARKRS